jgi:hypothetical protein
MAFDIDKYSETSVAVPWGDLDFTEFARNPLPEESLRVLRYMCDVEYHTVCYLRDLLVTPSHEEDDVAAFMTMWNREEFWHGEALAAVLGAHGIVVDFDELKATRMKMGWKDRLDPVKQSLLGNLVGNDFIATHMTWGAANEWSAVAAYNRMAELEKHPVLAVLLQRIAKQEARHVAFYTTQARERLERSRKARVLTRFALSKFWGPVGSTIEDADEVKHVFGHLFAGVDGLQAVRKLDQRISGLPGLQGLTIVENSMHKYGVALSEDEATAA